MDDAILPDGWTFARKGELRCPHGIGHPVPGMRDSVHGCDGCCTNEAFDKAVQAVRNRQ